MANEIANQALLNQVLSASTNIGDDELCPTKSQILANWNKSEISDSLYIYNDDCVCRIEDISKKKEDDPEIVIPEFDCIVLNYSWLNGSGADLDTATMIENGDPDLINAPVGCGQGTNPLRTIIDGVSYDCLYFGGDDTSDVGGSESILIYFSNIVNKNNFDIQPAIMDVGVYAAWHGIKGTGDIAVDIKAYKGGEMELQDLIFENVGGTLVLEDNIYINCNTEAKCNEPPSSKQKVAVVRYDKFTKKGRLQRY